VININKFLVNKLIFRYMVVGQKADKWLILKIEKMGFICIFGIKSGFFRTIGLKSNKIVRQ